MNNNEAPAAPALRFPVTMSPRGAQRLAALVRTTPALHVEGVFDRRGSVHATVVITGAPDEMRRAGDVFDRAFGR